MHPRLNGFLRTNSICPTPESVLLELVLKNDIENIERLVEPNTQLLNHIYTPEYNKPILLIACSEETVEPETVQTLIDLGADLHYSSEINEEWEALHFAACSTRSKLLRVIIDNFKSPGEINATAKGNNALHILIKHGRSDLSEEFVECAKLLIKEGIDINLGDSKFVSPILWAAKKGYRDIVKAILENGSVSVDIDSHQSRNKTARDIIVRENLYDGELPQKVDNNNEQDDAKLFKFLQIGNENAFVNFKNGDIFDLVNVDNSSVTLLQMCCNKGLKKAALHLINKGADPNLTTPRNRQTPLEIAAENGYYDIFLNLVDHPKIQMSVKILITLLKYYENEKFPGVDHAKCCNYLLKKLKVNKTLLDINEHDESKNSPLHFALRYADAEKVEELLRLGASLGSKNNYGVMPIQDIEPEMLQNHLDQCVQFDLKSKKFDKEDFSVTFNYRTLIPPTDRAEIKTSFDNSDPESSLSHIVTKELVAETEVISFMSKAPEFKYLLKHPVIVSFLFMKWHRIQCLFYTNLAFYIAFFLSLVAYIFMSYANFDESEKSSAESFFINLFWVVFLVTYFILMLRELFQIAVSPNRYFRNFENYIEIILIVLGGCILFVNDPSDDTRKQLSSLALLLAAFELVLMFGQHPKLSTNVVMLKTVSFNFFKFLIWYSLLIVAFALSFYILFAETEQTKSINQIAPDDGEEDIFIDPGRSLFKTIIMLTGEFDAGSLDFQHFPITSRVIFSLFIFMIVIILLNLLNGLAVSDTQAIKINAELVGHVARAQHIRYVESMLLGNVLPTNILNKINSICCCFPFNADWNFAALKPLAKRACLFPHFLNYELTVYTNKAGQIAIPFQGKRKWDGNCCLGACSYLYLDKETIKRTNDIVQAKRDQLKVYQEISHMQKIENIIQNLEKSACSDKMEIFLLNRKLDNILKFLTRDNNG